MVGFLLGAAMFVIGDRCKVSIQPPPPKETYYWRESNGDMCAQMSYGGEGGHRYYCYIYRRHKEGKFQTKEEGIAWIEKQEIPEDKVNHYPNP